MTDQELRELVARTAITASETTEQMKKTDAKLERIGIQLGNINQNIGATTEEYFYNSLYDNPMLGNIKFDTISKNIKWRGKRMQDEFDLVMYNGNSVAIIECKYKAHEDDLLKLMSKKVEHFRAISEEYRDYKIYLGLASFCFYPELEQLAHENGAAILKQKGDVVQVDADFLKAY